MRESSVKICPACGTSNPAGSRFCAICGSSLDTAGPVSGRDRYRDPEGPEREGEDHRFFSDRTGARTEAAFTTERIFPEEEGRGETESPYEPHVTFEGDSLIRTRPEGGGSDRKKPWLIIGAVVLFLLVAGISYSVTRLFMDRGKQPAVDDGQVAVEELPAGEEEAEDGYGTEETSGGQESFSEEEGDSAASVMRFSGESGLRDTFFYNGHEYRIYDMAAYGIENLDDPEADDDYIGYEALLEFCQERGGYLAVISDDAENTVLYQRVLETGEKSAFFACTDYESEGYWKWSGDEYSSYSNWNRSSGQPNNGYVKGEQQAAFGEDYAQFYQGASDGTWNDSVFATNTRLFLFEKEED